MKNNRFKTVLFIILVSFMLSSLSACNNSDEKFESNPHTSFSASEASDTSKQNDNQNSASQPETQIKCVNPLTGLETDKSSVNSRPTAVMINNIEYAQPLMGVSKADIIYECLVEGGITRLVAIYNNVSNVGTIGSIRSARPPFIEIARGFQALYIHCGTSTQANQLLKSGVINSFDLSNYNSMAWRDNNRVNQGYSYEHTLVTDGKTIVSGANQNGVDMTVSYKYPQKFGSNSQVTGGSSAKNITARFSGYKSTSFEYNEKEKTYIVSQFGEEMYDSTYSTRNTADNILVLSVNSYLIDDEHINLDLVGSGYGYYMNGGKAIKIQWSKADSDSPIEYKTESGDELIMKPGRQYVCCIPLTENVVFS